MPFFDVLKQSITGRPINLTEPTFIRDECDAQAQIEKMEELKKTAPPGIAKQIEQDIKMLSYGISGENMVAYDFRVALTTRYLSSIFAVKLIKY